MPSPACSKSIPQGQDKQYSQYETFALLGCYTAYVGNCLPASKKTTGLIATKGKAIPLQALTGPWGSRRLRLPKSPDNRHMKVVKFSALRTGRLYPQERFLVLISVRG